MIVIHPKDNTTRFLKSLYENKSEVRDIFTEKDSNSSIRNAMMGSKKIMMLGHGCESGLLSRKIEGGYFDRLIVNSKNVEFLRNKECIGIWCNANLFAEKYNLKGLFSGMIISELEEAICFSIETSEEEILEENKRFADNLSYCINNFELKDVPSKMIELNVNKTPLTLFNYNNIFYYE